MALPDSFTLARPIQRLVALGARRPLAVLVACLVLAAIAIAYAAQTFAMNTDTGALISPKVAWRRDEAAVEAAFPQLQDAVLVIVDGRTPELAEAGAARLAETLGRDRRHFNAVRRPDGGPFFAREGLLFGSVADVRATTAALIEAQPLLGAVAADPSLRGIAGALATALQGVAQGDAPLARLATPLHRLDAATTAALAGRPAFFSWQQLVGGTGALAAPTRRLVLLQPKLDYASLEPGEDAVAAVHAAAAALRLDAAHGARVQVTGEVPLADEEFATLQENIGWVGLVMALAMVATLWLATRSARIVAAIMGTTVAGLAITTALGLLAVGTLNLISVAFIPLFVGLGVDFGIQISVRFNAERAAAADPALALNAAAAALGAPLALAAGAVVLGFAAFLPTDYVGIAELGVIAAMGMVVALLLSVTLLPALLVLFRPGAPARAVGFRGAAPVDRWLARHRRTVLWAFAASMAVSIALLPQVRFDFNPLHLRDPNGPAMRALADLLRDPQRTPNTLNVLASDRAAARKIADRLSRLPEVADAVSLDTFVPADQPAKLALIGDASLLLDAVVNPFEVAPAPADAEDAAAIRTLAARLREAAGARQDAPARGARHYAATLDRLAAADPAARRRTAQALIEPLGIMLDSVRASLGATAITPDTLPPELRRDWLAPDGRALVEVFPRGGGVDNAALARFTAAVRRVSPGATGLPVATQEAGRTVTGAFVTAGLLALALISLLLFAMLRDGREVAFTLAPVVLAGFLTLGSCVVIGQPINFANIIAFPLLFGVGVAFHIYFVMAWRAGATDLLQSSLARAVFFSALATGSAFGALWLSRHPGTASMGKILMISLAWTLVCALIFEPALLGPPRRPVDSGRRRA
ncbi:MMPL family transporter [uncultured Sphingomonas sp.]|uniref:MMPL family transporter n=1 Tax=uncultured Sphingomonas sp. TaxID=158754 RepID=UPI0035C9EB77